MDNERTADVLQVALASYDRKELRVQKNYLEEQNPVLACTCFLNGHKLLQELQQGHNFDIVVLCSQMEDMSSIEFMMELRKLEHKPLLMLFDEGRRKNSSALRMEDSGSCCCVERMELKNLLRELYRMPGQQWQRTEQQCQQLYHSWGIRIPDINCSYLTSAVGVVYGTSQEETFLGRDFTQGKGYSETTAAEIDGEMRDIIDEAYETCRRTLTEHIDQLHALAKALMEREKLNEQQFNTIMAGGTLPPLEDPDAKQPEQTVQPAQPVETAEKAETAEHAEQAETAEQPTGQQPEQDPAPEQDAPEATE